MTNTLSQNSLTMFENLTKLTLLPSDAFYHTDHRIDGKFFRVFMYRLASYTDFLEADALEARGIMFEMSCNTINAVPIRLASRPMAKFFNFKENPLTIGIEDEAVEYIGEKADGSLISSYTTDTLRLKSKNSLKSVQATKAMEVLSEHYYFEQSVSELDRNGYTVNMEYCSPDNRIVLSYSEPQLLILNVIERETGKYIDLRELVAHGVIEEEWCVRMDYYVKETLGELADSMYPLKDIEGLVVKTASGFCKIKTHWYVNLHHQKDSINVFNTSGRKNLFKSVIEGNIDDLRQMFQTDVLTLKHINYMETYASIWYNHLQKLTEAFYANNKGLIRKDFAIKAKSELTNIQFGAVMLLFGERECDFKKIAIKSSQTFTETKRFIESITSL